MRRLGCADRPFVIDLLRRVITKHDYACGLWTVFEPGAFDGRDRDFIGQPGQDETGRFVPRWHRNQGDLRLDCSQGHESRQLGGWYFLPCSLRREVVFGPYDEHPLTGMPYLMVSRVAPLFDGERCIGALGIDVALDQLPRLAPVTTVCGPVHTHEDSAENVLQRWHCFISADGGIRFASPHLRQLFTFGGRFVLPPAVRQAYEAVRIRRQSHHQFSFAFGGRRLLASLVRHPHHDHWVLSLENDRRSSALRQAGSARLTPRESEVLSWVERGKTNAEIAIILGISGHTARHHLEKILAKLGVENRHAAMLYRRASTAIGEAEAPVSHTPMAQFQRAG